MSKAQGDGFRTYTDKGLNDHYKKVFLPKFIEMTDEQIKEYHINGGKIVCEQKNIVEADGYKVKSLKVTGREYILRIYADENNELATVVESYDDKDKANERFKFWKRQFEI